MSHKLVDPQMLGLFTPPNEASSFNLRSAQVGELPPGPTVAAAAAEISSPAHVCARCVARWVDGSVDGSVDGKMGGLTGG